MLPIYALTVFFAGMAFFLPQATFHTQEFNRWFVPVPSHRQQDTSHNPTPFFTPAPRPTTILPHATTATPIPLLPTATPTLAPVVSGRGIEALLSEVNAYRESQGLASITANSVTCDFAQTRAQEVSVSFTHDGFQNRVNQHTLPYSSYHVVVENIAMNSDTYAVVQSWISSPGHAANLRADTPYACIGQVGNYYAYEGWKP